MGNYRRSILNRSSNEWRTRDPGLAHLVEAYEEELRAMRRIDFDDMPLLAVRALRENKWLQHALLAKYPILVVDEYQDMGRALHLMVMGLCFGAGMRLFAVGDPDQSIYGFNGARPELLKQLSDRDDVETIHLRLNYRCGSRIVTASSYALGEDRDYEAIDGAEEGTIYFHPRIGQYSEQADYLFSTVLSDIQERQPNLRLGEIAILYPAAWIGDAVAEAAKEHGFPTIRTDGNSIYPRASRVMRWVEQCAQWCSGGWQTGSPRFSRILNEATRLFVEALMIEDNVFTFQRQLLTALWQRRDSNLSVHQWLIELRDTLNENCLQSVHPCRISGKRQSILERTAEGGDCAEMVVGQFAGQGEGNRYINLSTLHSSKGEILRVIMFAMDQNRIPRANSGPGEFVEARRLFYVGFTRTKAELHLMSTANRPSPFVTEVQERLDAGA